MHQTGNAMGGDGDPARTHHSRAIPAGHSLSATKTLPSAASWHWSTSGLLPPGSQAPAPPADSSSTYGAPLLSRNSSSCPPHPPTKTSVSSLPSWDLPACRKMCSLEDSRCTRSWDPLQMQNGLQTWIGESEKERAAWLRGRGMKEGGSSWGRW